MIGVFIFRRDLRVQDNHPLIKCVKKCSKVIPIFIFDPYQVDNTSKNKNYRSVNSIQFMIDCLDDLNDQVKNNLKIFYGDPLSVVKKINKSVQISVLGFNEDFSPYSQKRDEKIKKWCEDKEIELITYSHDNVLVDYDKVLSNSGDAYTVFSSYYKKAKKLKTNKVVNTNTSSKNFYKKKIPSEKTLESMKKKLVKKRNDELIKGGRSEALNILYGIKDFKDYNDKRDDLHYETTRLSAYLKFGCVSIREVYEKFKSKLSSKNELIKQLYWRSHYFVLARFHNSEYKYDHVEDKFKKVKWENDYKLGKLLWSGKTGYPVIDAGVRELNETGFMHNRARLLVASFSIKILHLSPFGHKWGGQEYFSRQLIDCCYANNYGNWLWVLGPYDPSGYRYGKKNTFSGRIFRDIVKFKKWDPELEYIRKWIPELDDVPDKDVFNWNTSHKKHDVYIDPIVDFEKRIKKWYKLTSK